MTARKLFGLDYIYLFVYQLRIILDKYLEKANI